MRLVGMWDLVPFCAIGGMVFFASGCGSSGGGAPVAPVAGVQVAATPTPSPASAPCGSSVTAVARIITLLTSVTEPRIDVRWTPLCDVDTADIVEYHILRDDSLVGVQPRNLNLFVDGNRTIGLDFTFQAVVFGPPAGFGSGDLLLNTPPANLPPVYELTVQFAKFPPFTTGTHVYTVTVVIGRAVNHRLVYEERIVGVSDPISVQ